MCQTPVVALYRHQTRGHSAWSVGTTGSKVLFALITPQYYMLLLLKIFTDTLNFAAPLILGQLVGCISSEASPPHETALDEARADGIADRLSALWSATENRYRAQWSVLLAGVLFVVAMLKAVLDAQYSYHINRMSIRAAGTIMQAPLASYLRKPAFVRQHFSPGAVLGDVYLLCSCMPCLVTVQLSRIILAMEEALILPHFHFRYVVSVRAKVLEWRGQHTVCRAPADSRFC